MSSSPAPANRATSTPIPVKTDTTKTMTRMKICELTPIAALPVCPTKLPTIAWSMMPCNPPMRFCTIVGQARCHTARLRGPSTIDRSSFFRGTVSVMRLGAMQTPSSDAVG